MSEKKRKDKLVLEVNDDLYNTISGAVEAMNARFLSESNGPCIDILAPTRSRVLSAPRVNGKRMIVLKGDEQRNHILNALYDYIRIHESDANMTADEKRMFIRYADAYNTVLEIPTQREYRREQKAALRDRCQAER